MHVLNAQQTLHKKRRASIAKGGPSNQEEALQFDEIVKNIHDAETRIQEIARAQQKREGEEKSKVGQRIKSDITAQSRDREETKNEKKTKARKRRESVALVNALAPKLHRPSQNNKNIKYIKPVAYQVSPLRPTLNPKPPLIYPYRKLQKYSKQKTKSVRISQTSCTEAETCTTFMDVCLLLLHLLITQPPCSLSPTNYLTI